VENIKEGAKKVNDYSCENEDSLAIELMHSQILLRQNTPSVREIGLKTTFIS
jgi:hypothetical protein